MMATLLFRKPVSALVLDSIAEHRITPQAVAYANLDDVAALLDTWQHENPDHTPEDVSFMLAGFIRYCAAQTRTYMEVAR